MSVKQVQATGVRACLLLHFVLVVWRVTVSWTDQYWLLIAAVVPFLLEGVFTVLRRNGVEWKLFSMCFFFYLCATLPGIWLLEIKKTQLYQSGNFSQIDDIVINGVEIPIRLSPDTWVLVVEEMMLYLMILGRWMLPRGDVGREQLTQLLFGFIGIASDIMELLSLFDDDDAIRSNTPLTYTILGVWSLSIMQFTLTFATAHRPRRTRGLRMSPSARSDGSDLDPDADHDHEDGHRRHRKSVLRVELFATVLSMFMQDGPFLAVRLYAMITYDIITYDLVFFTSKNVMVLLLLVYKIFLLLCKICCPSKRHHKSEDKEDLTHVHPNLDREIIAPKQDFDSLPKGDRDSGGLRKRRGERDDDHHHDVDIGDLQTAIEGPATPAKSMVKTKKYDRKASRDQKATQETPLSKDATGDTEEKGIDNPALDQGPDPDSGREKADPGTEPSSGWEDQDKRKPVDLNGGPVTNDPLARNEDPDENQSGVEPERKQSTGQKDDVEMRNPPEQRKDSDSVRTSGWDKVKKHVSVIKVKL